MLSVGSGVRGEFVGKSQEGGRVEGRRMAEVDEDGRVGMEVEAAERDGEEGRVGMEVEAAERNGGASGGILWW